MRRPDGSATVRPPSRPSAELDAGRLPDVSRRRARSVLLWTAALPLAIATLLSVWRVGTDRRSWFAQGVALAADSAATRIWSTTVSAAGPAQWSARAAAALPEFTPSGYQLTLYRLTDDAAARFGRVSPAAGVGPDASAAPGLQAASEGGAVLDAGSAARLLSLDRAFPSWRRGIVTGLAPVKDADQWDVVGAVAARSVELPPRRLPGGPLAAALLASLATTWLALRGAATRNRDRALLVLPSLLFLIGLFLFVDPVSGGSFRFWTLVFLGTALTCAAIGASLAGTAALPLRTREATWAWLFLAPSFMHLLLFSIGPILFALFLSFHEWNLLDAQRAFVGLGNYAELLRDAPFWRAVRNTAVYVLFVPAGMVLALALALLLDRAMPGVRVLRAIFFLPYVTSFVAISLVWKWMFEPDVGLLNNALRAFGLPAQPWLSSPATALPSLMLMSIWMYAGYMMVLFLAGLQSIPESLYESARMDGANAWQRFRRITLPLLRPTVFFVLVTMVIFMFQVFTAVYVMTEGGPLHATDVIVYHIYRNAWEYLRMGYASAMAWVLFAIVFVITLVQFRWLGQARVQ